MISEGQDWTLPGIARNSRFSVDPRYLPLGKASAVFVSVSRDPPLRIDAMLYRTVPVWAVFEKQIVHWKVDFWREEETVEVEIEVNMDRITIDLGMIAGNDETASFKEVSEEEL